MSIYLSSAMNTFPPTEEIHRQRGTHHGRKYTVGVCSERAIKLNYPEALPLNADYGAHIWFNIAHGWECKLEFVSLLGGLTISLGLTKQTLAVLASRKAPGRKGQLGLQMWAAARQRVPLLSAYLRVGRS